MVIITNDIVSELKAYLSSRKHDKVFVLTDTCTYEKCLPLLSPALESYGYISITIKDGDLNKNLEQAAVVWDTLSQSGASRNSLLICLGGGMVTDLGGFAGATFKRGLHNLYIPTTLMASVDAAIGGKTGVNFHGLKNEIGAFYLPDSVMIDCRFLKTLDRDDMRSGYAEMIKHGLISDKKTFYDTITFDIGQPNFQELKRLVGLSVAIKERFVAADFKEAGIRKALNFGQTVGHAFESLSFSLHQPLLHGHAVAAGMICELYLSYKVCGLSVELLRQVINGIKTHFPPFHFKCDHYEMIYALMTHDKKNEDGQIHFTLLGDVGDIRINQDVSKILTFEALDFYCDNY